MTLDEIMNHEGAVKLPKQYWINEKYITDPPTIRKIQVRTGREGQRATALVSWTIEIPSSCDWIATTRQKHEEIFDIADLEPAREPETR